MFKVYILKSLARPDKSYVGQTIKPLEYRLKEHNEGLSRFTKTDKPWKVFYFETFYCKVCTDKREQFFKSGVGHRLKKLLVAHSEDLR